VAGYPASFPFQRGKNNQDFLDLRIIANSVEFDGFRGRKTIFAPDYLKSIF
jgi:hypothetical protein